MRSVERNEVQQLQSVREKVLAAAVQLFATYGYHAATMRVIARMAGIQAASIYYHYANKQALLVEIMEAHMLQLNENLERIVSKQDSVQQRLYEAIANHIRLHTTFKSEFFIIDTEIRALEDKNRGNILALRDKYENMLQKLLREGMEQGILRETDEKVSSYAIIAMCTEVAGWFRPSGRLSVQQVIDIYAQMVTEGLLMAKEPAEKREESVHT